MVAFCLALVLFAPLGIPGRGGAGHPPATVGSSVAPAPVLAVAPADWWMEDGTNVTLYATWTEIRPGCSVAPEWYRWSVGSGVAEGTLDPTNASTTTFTAGGDGSGVTTLVVRSAAVVACDAGRTAAFGNATANLTVDAPLSVRNLSVGPNPAAPGTPTLLEGSIVGGLPPYSLRIAWGDGRVGWANESAPGPFAVPHEFGAGVFAPTLEVEDGAGFVSDAAVGEPLNVTSAFAASIEPSSPTAEVGIPVGFSIGYVNAPPSFSSITSCGGAAASADAANLSVGGIVCSFEAPGTAYVSFEAVGAASPYAVASALLPEPVAPRLDVRAMSPTANVQEGALGFVPVSIEGGVPPFNVTWQLVGDRGTGGETVPEDGTVYCPVRPSTAGADLFAVDVTDALDVSVGNTTETIDVLAGLSAGAALVVVTGPGSESINLSGSILAGSPPFDWAVVPEFAASNATNLSGTISGIGSFAWSATARAEGVSLVEVVIVDASGAVWDDGAPVDLLPPLEVSTNLTPLRSGGFEARIGIGGGAPPFAYWVNDSAGGSWSGTTPSDGTVAVQETPAGWGNSTIELSVRDAWGRSNVSYVTLALPAPPASDATAQSLAGALGALLFVALAAVGGAWWWRRRAATASVEAPDAVATLQRIISPADGADRAVVELVAEEDGIPLGVVRETLDRMIREGTVRAERGPDGEEVLAWAHDRVP